MRLTVARFAMFNRQIFLVFLMFLCCLVVALARPDGSDTHPVPGPGLAYGGIPYGSMSGNVAEFFRQRAAPSGRSVYQQHNGAGVDFAPIEQWL